MAKKNVLFNIVLKLKLQNYIEYCISPQHQI